MKTPLQVQFHGIDASAALEQRVRDYVGRMEKIAPDMIACRVMVSLEQKHQHQGRPYGVRIDATLPRRELVVNKIKDEDIYIALRDAFLAMRRQLEEVEERRSGAERAQSRAKSTVIAE